MMNTPRSLYFILNTMIFLVALSIVIGIAIAFLSTSGVVPINFNGKEITIDELTAGHYTFMGLNVIVYFVFTYGLYRLSQTAKLVMNNNIYNQELSRNCDLAGKSFVLSGTFWWFFDGFSSFVLEQVISIGVSEKTFIYLFIIAIGMFLMLTSKLFHNANELKRDNELTI